MLLLTTGSGAIEIAGLVSCIGSVISRLRVAVNGLVLFIFFAPFVFLLLFKSDAHDEDEEAELVDDVEESSSVLDVDWLDEDVDDDVWLLDCDDDLLEALLRHEMDDDRLFNNFVFNFAFSLAEPLDVLSVDFFSFAPVACWIFLGFL